MGFTKIENSDLNDIGVIGLPDRPGLSTAAMQAKLEETSRSVVIPKHNELIDELEDSTSASNLGASPVTGRTSSPNVQAVMEKLSTDLKTVEDGMAEAIADAHTHDNKTLLDSFEDDGTGLTYNGSPVGAVTSVNSQTGDVVLSASDVGALPDSTTIPTNTSDLVNDSGFITSSDIPSIPTKTSDLSNDSNFVADASYVHTDNNYDATAKGIVDGATAAIASKSTVTYSQTYTQAGQKIGEITIDGTKTDLVAPSGGGGGGGAVDSVNGQTGTVVLNQSDINDVTITSLADQHTLVYNANSSIWENEKLADVALTNSYNDLDDQPTIPTKVGDLTNDSGYQTAGDVATAISGKADTSSLGDLAYIDTDGVSSTKVLQGDGTWINPPAGYDMIPVVNDIATLKALTDGDDDYVLNAYTAKRWSNVDAITLYTTLQAGTDTIGAWNDNWKEEVTPDRSGWIWHTALLGILSDNDIDFQIVFDPSDEEAVSLYAYRVDDNYTPTGETEAGGCVAIKFNNAPSTDVTVGISLSRKRTTAIQVTPLT